MSKIDLSQKNFLLPPKTSSKKTLVLDLDETLVHSQFIPYSIKSDLILKIDIENNHQKNMQKSEINIKNELKEMDNNIILLKRKSELNIIKSNQNHELEEKKINNEIEIDKIRIQHKYREKIIEEELKKQIILKMQDLEKEEMEMKLKLMIGQIILKKLYN